MALGAVRYLSEEDDPRDDMRTAVAEFLLRIRRLGIMDHRILAALESVPRPLFLEGNPTPGPLFSERPQPIACGQIGTPPVLVARILSALALTGRERVLEIGTGTGYLTAAMSMMARHVYTVERFRTLLSAAEARFAAIRSDAISPMFGDGLWGWSAKAPFDRIVTTAAAEEVPKHLAEQLSVHGVLIMPIGPAGGEQMLTRFARVDRALEASPICTVRMTPLLSGKAVRL